MILVDTSAWIEWLIGSPTGDMLAEHLPELADWLVPTMVQLELAKWLAREAGVGHLVLHHISRRYHSKQILDEAAAIFPATSVARDLDLFRLVKGKALERVDVRERAEGDAGTR